MVDEERRRRALELLDMAHRVMEEGPQLHTGFTPIEIGNFRFEPIRLETEGTAERTGHLPNALNVAWREGIVLTAKFSRRFTEPQVLHYEPGEWERELEFLLTPGHGRAQ